LVDGGEMGLQHGAAALGFDGIVGIEIGRVLDELERDGVLKLGVLRQVHVGHAAAAEFAEDLVLADFTRRGRNHYFRPPKGGATGSGRRPPPRPASPRPAPASRK